MVKVVVRDKKKKDVTEKTRKKITHRRVAGGEWEKVTDKNRNDKWAGGGVKTNKATADFDRAVKAGTMLSAKKETERKKRSKELGIKYIPGRELPKKEETETKTEELKETTTPDSFINKLGEVIDKTGKVLGGEDIEILGMNIKTGLGEEIKKGEVIAGTPPLLDPTTQAWKLANLANTALKTSKKELTIGRLVDLMGANPKQARSALKKAETFKASDLVSKAKSLTTNPKIFVTTVSQQIIVFWGAVDNIAGTATFDAQTLLDSVTFSDPENPITPQQVNARKQQIQDKVTFAKNGARIAAIINPITGYPFYKYWGQVIEDAQDTIDFDFAEIDRKMGINVVEEQQETTDL